MRTEPAYLVIAHDMENAILDGEVSEDALAPSAGVLARRYGVNIATSARALRTLQDRGVVRRLPGIGMYILAGCRAALLTGRRANFVRDHIEPLIDEAHRLGLSNIDLMGELSARLRAADSTAATRADDLNEH
ncbi:GntR family transcriptional regulator [Microbacterium lacticum]|uniref:GntR family transcriptional regulator n=1 Tax=Microbacterium lacticum TaxID=33885 RepID=UPI0018B0D7D6|nr:GntR family transcriptional regulator [Microbacterium lacticum]MBF9335608.1 GntR family transcriptional regulator [Microbacterium lacticum]